MDLLLLVIALLYIIRNRKTEWVLTIMLALGTNLFQAWKFFANAMLIPNMYDGALVILLALLIKYRNNKPTLPAEYRSLTKYITFFSCYIVLLIFLDIILNNISIISVIKTSRHWLFLLAIFVIPKIPVITLKKTLYIVMNITLVISAIIAFEFFTGNYYFTEIHYEGGVARGALPSTFALFYTMVLACNYYNKMNKARRYTYLAILILSLLASSTRSIALAIVFGFMICIYFCSRNKANSFGKMFLFILLAGAVAMFTPGLKERFSQLGTELSASRANNDVEGNTTYRLMHFTERFEYLQEKPMQLMFGIGNVVEEDFPDVFYVGLYNENKQRITQLDTGDITWSPVLMRLGVIGIFLFVTLALKAIKCAARHIPDKLAVATTAYLAITFIILSFAGTQCYRATFWIMPAICLCVIGKDLLVTNKPFDKYGQDNYCNSNF